MYDARPFRALVALVSFTAALVTAAPALAQAIDVKQPWVRSTVAGQKVAGAYMDITSPTAARLVSAASPVANVVEIHNMKMENGVMKMYAVDGIDVPANGTVKLAPGGYHVMLMELKQQLKPGDRVPLKLTFELGKERRTVELTAEVRDVKSQNKGHAGGHH